MNEMKELKKMLSKGEAEAICRKCKEDEVSVIEFLITCLQDYADDEFSDLIGELCDSYGIEQFDDEELEIFNKWEHYKAWVIKERGNDDEDPNED